MRLPATARRIKKGKLASTNFDKFRPILDKFKQLQKSLNNAKIRKE